MLGDEDILVKARIHELMNGGLEARLGLLLLEEDLQLALERTRSAGIEGQLRSFVVHLSRCVELLHRVAIAAHLEGRVGDEWTGGGRPPTRSFRLPPTSPLPHLLRSQTDTDAFLYPRNSSH